MKTDPTGSVASASILQEKGGSFTNKRERRRPSLGPGRTPFPCCVTSWVESSARQFPHSAPTQGPESVGPFQALGRRRQGRQSQWDGETWSALKAMPRPAPETEARPHAGKEGQGLGVQGRGRRRIAQEPLRRSQVPGCAGPRRGPRLPERGAAGVGRPEQPPFAGESPREEWAPGSPQGPPRSLCWPLSRRGERGEESSQSEGPGLACAPTREQPLLQPPGLGRLTGHLPESRHRPRRPRVSTRGCPRPVPTASRTQRTQLRPKSSLQPRTSSRRFTGTRSTPCPTRRNSQRLTSPRRNAGRRRNTKKTDSENNQETYIHPEPTRTSEPGNKEVKTVVMTVFLVFDKFSKDMEGGI